MTGWVVDFQDLVLFYVGIGLGDCGEQRTRVGVCRMLKERLRVRHFNDLTLVYHGNTVADEPHDG